jgi:hypothetical protein
MMATDNKGQNRADNDTKIESKNGGTDMNAVMKEDVLAAFIRTNKEKILKITPVNPPIKKDDQWRKEDYWDDYEVNEPDDD